MYFKLDLLNKTNGQSCKEKSTTTSILKRREYVRRKVIHEYSFQSPLSMHCFIDRYIAELMAAGEGDRHTSRHPEHGTATPSS
jgi:hypothetical protein